MSFSVGMLRTDSDGLEGNIFKHNAYRKRNVPEAQMWEFNHMYVFIFNIDELFAHTTRASARLIVVTKNTQGFIFNLEYILKIHV